MTRKLNSADRVAVDMLFDRLSGNEDVKSDGYVAMSGSVDEARLSAVENILKQLDQMPTPEPSADLAVRTLQRIARSSAAAVVPAMPANFVNPNQPLA